MNYQNENILRENKRACDLVYSEADMEQSHKKNVIIVSPSLAPKLNVGGVSSVVRFLIKNNKNVRYVHFQQGKTDIERGGKFIRFKRIFRNYIAWIRLLKKEKTSLIHYNTSMDTKSILRDALFIRYANLRHHKILIHIHGGKYLFEKNKPLLIDKILKSLFNLKNPIIVLSNEEKEVIQKGYRCKEVFVMPNVVDLTETSSFSRKNQKIKKRIDILFIGRITEEKGIESIIDACKILQDEGINFMLHVAGKEQGDKHYLSQMSTVLSNSFKYEGVVYGKTKSELFKQCDIFLLPSFYEGLPMSLLEAMSFAEVPIVTQVGSINTVVKDKYNGFFVNVKDGQSIAKVVKMLISDPAFMKELSDNAQSTIFEKYNPSKYVNRRPKGDCPWRTDAAA